MSAYYEDDKPFSRENWNKLIRDLNENLEDAPGSCPNIEPLEEVDPDHIWTVGDVEAVRDKIMEMCDENEFNEDLSKPWREAVIDEIENQMDHWCGCGVGPFLLETRIPELGQCIFDPHPEGDLIDINGMSVCPRDGVWRVIRRIFYRGAISESRQILVGAIDCSGNVVYDGDYKIPFLFEHYQCMDPDYCDRDNWIWFIWILGEEWWEEFSALCPGIVEERNQQEIEWAEERVAVRIADGEYREYWLYVNCNSASESTCPEE